VPIYTIRTEAADGKPEEVTSVHVDHGDGSASWIVAGALDTTKPAGSPLSWRQIGRRLRDDAKTLARFVPAPTPKPAPAGEAFERGEVVAR